MRSGSKKKYPSIKDDLLAVIEVQEPFVIEEQPFRIESLAPVVPDDKVLPDEVFVKTISSDNYFLGLAKQWALNHSMDSAQPVGAVIVIGNIVYGSGANGALYHKQQGCERKKRGIPSGQQYELCPGCSVKNHAEPKAIQACKDWNRSPEGASIYVWGHWFICRHCHDLCKDVGIRTIYLPDNAKEAFDFTITPGPALDISRAGEYIPHCCNL